MSPRGATWYQVAPTPPAIAATSRFTPTQARLWRCGRTGPFLRGGMHSRVAPVRPPALATRSFTPLLPPLRPSRPTVQSRCGVTPPRATAPRRPPAAATPRSSALAPPLRRSKMMARSACGVTLSKVGPAVLRASVGQKSPLRARRLSRARAAMARSLRGGRLWLAARVRLPAASSQCSRPPWRPRMSHWQLCPWQQARP